MVLQEDKPQENQHAMWGLILGECPAVQQRREVAA